MPASTNKINCPVCGMEVDEKTDYQFNQGGDTYYFCSEKDLKEFEKHPLQYLKKEKKVA